MTKVTFATSCWEKDWRLVLGGNYLRDLQIGNHCFPFAEKVLIINNVKDLNAVRAAAEKRVIEGALTRYVVAEEMADEVMSFFQLARGDFRTGDDAIQYEGVIPDWIYFNALAPLTALYVCQSDYLLYMTGDVCLEQKVRWIPKALKRMERTPCYKVANLCWNHQYKEAKRESYQRDFYFYIANRGFSDQMFLVRSTDFRKPIYNKIRADSSHYPRGDVWEKRVFSHMMDQDPPWERLIYRWGSYTHEFIF